MLEGILNYSTQWKDLFWIVFTLVATITSLLTYLQVRKTIRQPLYNRVIESQVDVYSRLLELLKDSSEVFIYSCKFDLLIRYNLISHCVHFGFFENQELTQKIYQNYMALIWKEDREESFDLEEQLEQIESITIYGSDSVNHGEMAYRENTEFDEKKTKRKEYGIGVYQLTNIRGALFQTPSFQKLYEELQSCMNNIYLPKQLIKRLNCFHQALLKVMLEKMVKIIQREEEKILSAESGEEIIVQFDELFNELLEECKDLMKQHELVRKEIRKLLKIDASW